MWRTLPMETADLKWGRQKSKIFIMGGCVRRNGQQTPRRHSHGWLSGVFYVSAQIKLDLPVREELEKSRPALGGKLRRK
jgi:hypothetical protein